MRQVVPDPLQRQPPRRERRAERQVERAGAQELRQTGRGLGVFHEVSSTFACGGGDVVPARAGRRTGHAGASALGARRPHHDVIPH